MRIIINLVTYVTKGHLDYKHDICNKKTKQVEMIAKNIVLMRLTWVYQTTNMTRCVGFKKVRALYSHALSYHT